MTTPAEISVLRRPFGLPVTLSLALHGLAAAALGAAGTAIYCATLLRSRREVR